MSTQLLKLKEIMAKKNISGKDMAEKVNVTPATISNIVQGNSFPKPELLLDIAKALDVDVRSLFYPTKLQEYDQIKHEQLVKIINVINGNESLKVKEVSISINELTDTNDINAGITTFLNVLNVRAGSSGQYNLYDLLQRYLTDEQARNEINKII